MLFILTYPNPVTDRATIQFPNPDHKLYRLILTDLTGKIVKSLSSITGETVEISPTGISRGLYMLELRGPKIYRGKILIE